MNIANSQTRIGGEQSGVLKKAGSPYVLEQGGFIIPEGKTLTIEPGVEIRSTHPGDIIQVNGTLLANGTAADSIRFVGKLDNPSPSFTNGGHISFNAKSNGSSLQFVVLDRMGDTYYNNYGAVRISTSEVSITRCLVRNGRDNGMYVDGNAEPLISNNKFQSTPVSISSGINNFSNISENANSILKIRNSDNNSHNAVLPKAGDNAYYILEYGSTISEGYTLKINPGVEIRSYNANDLITINGTLIAKGTPADSIRFRGFSNLQSPGFTHGGSINFSSKSKNSELEYLSIDQMGDTYYNFMGAIRIGSSSVSIKHSMIRNCEENSISIDENVNPDISFNSFTNNPVAIYAGISSFSKVLDNRNAVLKIKNGTANTQNVILPKAGEKSWYTMEYGFVIAEGSTLDIKPGVEIRSSYPNDVITVNGTLIAKGTEADSIRLTGFATPSTNGFSHGGRLVFSASSKNSQLDYLSVNRMGDTFYSAQGAVQISSTSVSITNSFFNNSEGPAIGIVSALVSPVIAKNKFSGNNGDIEAYVGNCSGIQNNTNARIMISGGALLTINATWPFPGNNSYYVLQHAVTVNRNYSLTIEPGVLVDFSLYGQLVVEGTLKSIGTPANRIRFTVLEPSTATRGQIALTSQSTDSEIRYSDITNLGSVNYNYAALKIETADFVLANTNINNSSYQGIGMSQTTAAEITDCIISGNPYGVYSYYGRLKLTNCNIYGNTKYGVFNGSSQEADVIDARNTYWGSTEGPKHPVLNPAGKGNEISNNVLFQPWLQKPQNGQIIDINVDAIASPLSNCGLGKTETVSVKLLNKGNTSLASIGISYKVNEFAEVKEIIPGQLEPGQTITYNFTKTIDLSAVGSYNLSIFTSLEEDNDRTNDTVKAAIHHLPEIVPPTGLLPANNSSGIDIPTYFNWAAVTGADGYDLYLWKKDAPEPTQPIAAGITEVRYFVPATQLSNGTVYNWKVVSRRASCTAESITHTFATSSLPDLVVESIVSPLKATSETEITFNWKIKNTGSEGTGNTRWEEVIYFSDQPVLNTGQDNIYIASVTNLSALKPNESYQSIDHKFKIPRGKQGIYYIIVKTNATNTVTESIYSNNQLVSIPINIELTPPPDLQVTALTVNPLAAFSEDSITVNYTIKNMGPGPANEVTWFDQIFLNKNESGAVSSGNLLKQQLMAKSLPAGAEYKESTKVRLPAGIEGTYYIQVLADGSQQLFEYDKEDNNLKASLAVNVVRRPAPDLNVKDLSIPVSVLSGGQSVALTWTTINSGAISAQSHIMEYVYLSAQPIFNEETASMIGVSSIPDSVKSLGEYFSQYRMTLPAALPAGDYYIHVKTDATQSVFETDETNNIGTSIPVKVLNPDLNIKAISVPKAAFSQEKINVEWEVQNNGPGSLYGVSWTDRIYLSDDQILDPLKDLLLSESNQISFLASGALYKKTALVTLPLGISGTHYIIVKTDAGERVLEGSETNNEINSKISILLAPWPDLVPLSIKTPTVDTAGTGINIKYEVKNIGRGDVGELTWSDQLYLAPQLSSSVSEWVYIGQVSNNRNRLATGEAYIQDVLFTLPSNLKEGPYFPVIKTNTDNTVFENTDINNNVLIGKAIIIKHLPAIDLSVTSARILSNSITAGQPLSVTWSVKNNSGDPTYVSTWKDAVYLSDNVILDKTDRLLSDIVVRMVLGPGKTYTKEYSVNIPQDAEGALYLIVATDVENQHKDDKPGNNFLAINTTLNGEALNVVVPLAADLTIDSFIAPEQLMAQQVVRASFKIKNTGPGATGTSYWKDNIYLGKSNDDQSRVLLKSIAHYGTLASGATYETTSDFQIPTDALGNYLLILETDADHNVYEKNGEANNFSQLSTLIKKQESSDLAVENINFANQIYNAGSLVTVNWKLSNQGLNSSVGLLREGVYLSKDPIYDSSDALLGFIDSQIQLPSRAIINQSLSGILSGISPGFYYVLVKSDLLNAIVETNKINNTGVSLGKIEVKVKELKIDMTTSGELSNVAPVYYRVEIPSTLNKSALSVALKGNSKKNAVNRLYLQKDSIPTSNRFEFSSSVPLMADQEIIVPSLDPGTYYIAVMGSDTSHVNQPFSILAKVIPFGLHAVDASRGGNTGLVTIRITGARFEPDMTVKLIGGGEHVAQVVYYTDASRIFATFNLSGATIGKYTVSLEKRGGGKAQMVNGFEVVKGTPGGAAGASQLFTCSIQNIGFDKNIDLDVVHPVSVRRNQNAKMTISFTNGGNVDIPVQSRIIMSLEGAPINYTPDFKKQLKELILELSDADGPPGILRAGSSGYIDIYAHAIAPMSFIITQ